MCYLKHERFLFVCVFLALPCVLALQMKPCYCSHNGKKKKENKQSDLHGIASFKMPLLYFGFPKYFFFSTLPFTVALMTSSRTWCFLYGLHVFI